MKAMKMLVLTAAIGGIAAVPAVAAPDAECRAEIRQTCPEATTRAEFRTCLRERYGRLSAGCLHQVMAEARERRARERN